ncbi:MAG: ribulokinase [Angelakisella sp.]
MTSIQYALGLDYGTLSVRALLVEMNTGREAAEAVYTYPHGVMHSALPDGTQLPPDFALAHPADYLEGLFTVVPQVMEKAGITGAQVTGIGISATSATLVPLSGDLTPLCLLPGFENRPHAYIKLWKHHGAVPQTQRMYETALNRGEPWLQNFGGRINCEFLMPKILETALQDPEVYEKTVYMAEMGEWLTGVLTGTFAKSRCMASCNSLYDEQNGFPKSDFFTECYPEINPPLQKLDAPLVSLGSTTGTLESAVAEQLGLPAGLPIASAIIDSHSAVLGCGATQAGDLVAVLGTSACYLYSDRSGGGIPGIYSAAYQAHAPGLYGYEGGQSCVGDLLAWAVERIIPAQCYEEARSHGMNIHQYLMEKAASLPPGGHGLIALDWWSGVRSPLMNPRLTGVLSGLTLDTQPEEIYLALLEAICFGARRIIETFTEAGHTIARCFAAGGIPQRNPLLMQVLSNICNREFAVCGSAQASALGAAILGAAAAGQPEDFAQHISRMAAAPTGSYCPQQDKVEEYERLYQKYLRMSAFFEEEEKR